MDKQATVIAGYVDDAAQRAGSLSADRLDEIVYEITHTYNRGTISAIAALTSSAQVQAALRAWLEWDLAESLSVPAIVTLTYGTL